jgi:hypothetical protein
VIQRRKAALSLKTIIAITLFGMGVGFLLVSFQVTVLVFISGVVIVLSGWMMQRTIRVFNLRALTIPGFFYWAYLGVIVFPAFFVFADQIDPYRYRYLFAVESVLITVPLGVVSVNWALHFKRKEIGDYYDRPTTGGSPRGSTVTVFLLLFTLAVVLSLVRLDEIKTVPILHLIHNPGDLFGVTELREEADKLLDSPLHYAYHVLGTVVYPLLIVLAFGRYAQGKRGRWFTLFVASLITGIFFVSLTAEKSLVSTIFAVIFLFYYLWKGGKPAKASVVLAPVLFVAFPLFVIMRTYSGTHAGTLPGALQAIGRRIFYAPAEVLYYYFEVFPGVVPYQHGASIGKLSALMGWKTLDIPNIVGLYMTGRGPGTLSTITANAAFIGNLNVDFGLYGVVAGGFLAGVLMQAAQIYILRQPKTILNLSIYSFMMYSSAKLTYAPLPVLLLSEGTLLAALLVMIGGALRRYSLRLGGARTWVRPETPENRMERAIRLPGERGL